MLDEKGIYLNEISSKYPKMYQTLGYDVLMDVDSMYKPKVISTFEMCVNAILTLLFMKKGQYPSIPELGIDINSYLFEYADDPNVPQRIHTQLNEQCNRIGIVGVEFNCSVETTTDGTNALLVEIKGDERLSYGADSGHIIIGITYDKLNRLYARKYYL